MRAPLALALAALGWGCVGGGGCGCSKGGGDGDPAAAALLHAPTAQPVDPAAAARDPEALLRALRARHRDTAARLGAHRFRATRALRVYENGKEIEALDETSEIDQDAQGGFRARYANSRDYGREAVFAGGTLWIRPLYGKYHRRPPTDAGEPAHIADDIYATLAADFELVARAAVPRDAGPAQVAGRSARRVQLALGRARRSAPERRPDKAWRDTVTVLSLDGEAALDEATGTVLEGRLTARVSFVRAGRTFELSLATTHAVTDVGAAVEVTPPPDELSAPTPLRSQDFEDREELLDGLAPPAKRAPTPGGHE